MNSFESLATAHLILCLQPLHRALRAAVEKQKVASARLDRPELSSLCLTDQHVHVLLDQIDEAQGGSILPGSPVRLTVEEENTEAHLRDQCGDFAHALPLDRLECDLHLSPFEIEVILLCAAAELDRGYGRVFSYLHDDLNRRAPSLELLTTLTAASREEVIERRHALSPFGRVRRCRVLQPIGDSPTELGQEFRLAPGLFDFLTGLDTDILRICSDRSEVPIPAGAERPAQVPESEFINLCAAIEQGTISVLGIWGPRQNGVEELVAALCTALRKPLRRLSILDLERAGSDASATLFDQLRVASGVGGILWLDTDALRDPSRERIQELLAETLGRSIGPVFITGEQPWRPLSILRSGAYSEFELGETDYPSREKLWSQFFPELEAPEVNNLASRFSLSGSDIRSISDLARMRARLAGNGTPDPVQGHVVAACAVITRRSSGNFATIIQPRRGPSDLVLADKLHRQIVEVATFFQLRNQVDGAWGFGRLLTGGGMKALFTGEPGTGKTLAAEVVASLLGQPLYKVDLARIVSKWVGETEKNLECAFREAEESHAVLFFDEAEALFGKRAEVQHGTDRYANLEVSYLLQRLESSRGLVILASNIKDQIDPAFTRRFHVAIHFPKPEFEERLRIWQLAFPPSAPLDPEIDWEALAKLNMTGAGIVSAARTAALLAANAGVPSITMSHVVQSAARQFRREARVLTPVELGPYSILLQGVL